MTPRRIFPGVSWGAFCDHPQPLGSSACPREGGIGDDEEDSSGSMPERRLRPDVARKSATATGESRPGGINGRIPDDLYKLRELWA